MDPERFEREREATGRHRVRNFVKSFSCGVTVTETMWVASIMTRTRDRRGFHEAVTLISPSLSLRPSHLDERAMSDPEPYKSESSNRTQAVPATDELMIQFSSPRFARRTSFNWGKISCAHPSSSRPIITPTQRIARIYRRSPP